MQLVLAFDMGLAALLGDTIYNFGELLAHPIFAELTDSEYEVTPVMHTHTQ